MIPVLAVSLIRPDLIHRMLASVDVPVGRLIVVDNGAGIGDIDGAWMIHMPRNLPVSAVHNLILKMTPEAPWWALVSDDIVFAPGDLARLAAAMATPDPFIATLDGFAAWGMNSPALDRLGYMDENFVPAYCEDCDIEYRCRLLGVPIVPVPAGLRHERSSTIALPFYREQNDRTYPQNVAYYRRKWGGSMRGGEVFTTPFDAGGTVNDWTLDPKRLRDLGWETTTLPTVGETR
jgi:hypothetical protein